MNEKDWVKCMAISAMIENTAWYAGKYLYEKGDTPVQKVLDVVMVDEAKHLAFSREQMKICIELQEHNKEKVAAVLKKVKLLLFDVGKNNQFNVHDLVVARCAEEAVLMDMDKIGIRMICGRRIETSNGYWRNLFFKFIIQMKFILWKIKFHFRNLFIP